MDREIKFRGKRLDNGEWVYGYYLYASNGKLEADPDEMPLHLIYSYTDRHFLDNFYIVDPATVGQFIGRQDGHGQDMYEGDKAIWIAKANAELNYEGVISWDEKSLGWSHGDCGMDIYDNYKIIDETEVSRGAKDGE